MRCLRLAGRATAHAQPACRRFSLLASHAPGSADAEEISTDRLALRLGLGRRAPVRATATLTRKDCDVTRRAADSRPRLVAVPADNALCARRPRAGSASCLRTRSQAHLAALARAPVRECSSGSLAFCALHAAGCVPQLAHGELHTLERCAP
jgi:hypothetical protein